jgi:hypothetical protein
MRFTCAYCGAGSFTIVSDVTGSQFATCNKSGKTTPFEKEQMTNPRMEPHSSRKLHLNLTKGVREIG